MKIAIPLYDRFTALDAVGPYEVLSRLPGAEVSFVAAEPGPKRTDNGMLALARRRRARRLPDPDVLVVPGGFGTRALHERRADLLDWVRGVHETSQWTTSVCTGSLLLGAAGLLDGLEATTHWPRSRRCARVRRDTRPSERVVEQGKVDHRGRRLVGHRHGADARRARSPATKSPRRSSSASSTTRSRRSTPARRPRRRRRSRTWSARPLEPSARPSARRARRASRSRRTGL